MAHNPVAANLIMVFCLVGGFLSLSWITQEVFPSTEADIVRVRASYPGASPEEVEQGLLLVIEEAVRGLDGVDEVSATAGEGSGTVEVAAPQVLDLAPPEEDTRSIVCNGPFTKRIFTHINTSGRDPVRAVVSRLPVPCWRLEISHKL